MLASFHAVISMNVFETVLPGSLDESTVYFCPVLKRRNVKTTQMWHKCHVIDSLNSLRFCEDINNCLIT